MRKFLTSRVFVSPRHTSETWRILSDMGGHMSGGGNKRRMQNFRSMNCSGFILSGLKLAEKLKGIDGNLFAMFLKMSFPCC